MKTLTNFTQIVVPLAAMESEQVTDAIDAMTKHVGGVTVVDGDGQWFDGKNMVSEPVAVHTWRHDDQPLDIVNVVLVTLFEYGEKELLVTLGDVGGSGSYLMERSDFNM